jgi:hypothetical protein
MITKKMAHNLTNSVRNMPWTDSPYCEVRLTSSHGLSLGTVVSHLFAMRLRVYSSIYLLQSTCSTNTVTSSSHAKQRPLTDRTAPRRWSHYYHRFRLRLLHRVISGPNDVLGQSKYYIPIWKIWSLNPVIFFFSRGLFVMHPVPCPCGVTTFAFSDIVGLSQKRTSLMAKSHLWMKT